MTKTVISYMQNEVERMFNDGDKSTICILRVACLLTVDSVL